MNDFWTGDTYAIVKAMRRAGNQPGLIEQWKSLVEMWANAEGGADAAAVKAWLPNWRSRPFYTAEELAPMWPALAVAIGYSKYLPVQKSPQRLAFELDYAGLPFRIIWGRRYYIVEQIHRWRDMPQQEIENALLNG